MISFVGYSSVISYDESNVATSHNSIDVLPVLLVPSRLAPAGHSVGMERVPNRQNDYVRGATTLNPRHPNG